MTTLLVLLAIGVLIIIVVAVSSRSADADFKRRVGKVNEERALTFSTSPVLGTLNTGIVFDRTNRKMLYVSAGAAEVLDYGYFTRWAFRKEQQRNGTVHDRRIVLDTTDFNRPQMTFVMRSDKEGSEWVARLDVVFNQE